MENCLKIAVLLGLMVQLCYTLQLGYQNCGSSATIEGLDITPCESDPCILHKGQNYVVNVTFTAAASSKTVKTVGHAIVGLMKFPLPIPSDSCKNRHLACPIEAGATVTYSYIMEIAKRYPTVGFKAKWEISDDKGSNIVCFVVPLRIQ